MMQGVVVARAMAKGPRSLEGGLENSLEAGVVRTNHLGGCGGQRKVFWERNKMSSEELACELGVVLK